MALFQFRKGRDEQTSKVAAPQTVEAVRLRAMHRLIGAAVLVLAGVIGFPLVFDNQPRPIAVDLPIEIVDKNKVKPLVAPPATAPAAAVAVAAAPAVVAPVRVAASTPVAESPVAPTVPAVATGPVASAPLATTAKSADRPGETTVASASDASKAQALLDGKDVGAAVPGNEARFVVQVGAFSDAEKVREVRQKVESAGFKTYTQVVDTKEGSRTRVRVGPFPDRADALRVAEKIRKLDLPAAILSL